MGNTIAVKALNIANSAPTPVAAAKKAPVLVPIAPLGACIVMKKTATPAPRIDECNSKDTVEVTLKNPLFSGEPSPSQVGQGYVGDCYFCSAVAAIAKQNPAAIKNMIKENPDGTYTVTFKMRGPFGVIIDVPVKVDSKVWANTSNANPTYGGDPTGKTKWFAIMEKAYVKFKSSSSYAGISGGYGAEGFGAVLGVSTTTTRLSSSQTFADLQGTVVGAKIDAAFANKKPIVINTGSSVSTKGLVSSHSYHVLDVKKDEDGDVKVLLRNPWGQRGEPTKAGKPADGADDGCFWVRAKDLGKDFDSVEIAN